MGWLSPYLISTAQGYGTTSIELTHGEDFDFPMQLEYLQPIGACAKVGIRSCLQLSVPQGLTSHPPP